MKRLTFAFLLLACNARAEATNEGHALEWTNAANLTNVLAEYNKMRDVCKWGGATNGVQLGVGIWGSSQLEVHTLLLSTNPGGMSGPTPPPHGYRFDLELKCPDGELVPRTSFGDSICRPVSMYMTRTMHIEGMHGIFNTSNVPRKYDDAFDLWDCFDIKKEGTYVLTIKGASLYWRGTPGFAKANVISIPETSIDVNITASDVDHHRLTKGEAQ